MAWQCSKCDRLFGAEGQSHICQPGYTVEEFCQRSRRPETEPIFRAIHQHLAALEGGELIVDPLAEKLLLKNGPMFAMLEPKTKWVALAFSLRRKLESGRLSRKVTEMGSVYHHVVNLTDPDQVDDEILEWLTEAFYRADPPATARQSDPMVPDDVEDLFDEP